VAFVVAYEIDFACHIMTFAYDHMPLGRSEGGPLEALIKSAKR
jgi:hypothetical protein